MVIKKPFAEIAEADYDKIFAINSKAAFFYMQEAGRNLNDHGKLCTVVNSLLGALAGLDSIYAGSKSPVEHFTRAVSPSRYSGFESQYIGGAWRQLSMERVARHQPDSLESGRSDMRHPGRTVLMNVRRGIRHYTPTILSFNLQHVIRSVLPGVQNTRPVSFTNIGVSIA